MRIVPAVLANSADELSSLVRTAETFADYVQFDFMDGLFVPSKSASIEDLAGLKPSVRSEAHLMVREPESYLQGLKTAGTERVIFHVEAVNDPEETIRSIRDHGFDAGLAVNPGTSNKDVDYLISQVNTVLFLAVNPGFYGAPFIPEVLDKIADLRGKYPEAEIGIDGGMKRDNVQDAVKAGVDYICIGSAIFNAEDPKKAYEDIISAVSK